MKFRHNKINFEKSMQFLCKRKRLRRRISLYYKNCKKDRIWHRCVKRSIKHYEKIALIDIIKDNTER